MGKAKQSNLKMNACDTLARHISGFQFKDTKL